MRSSIRSRIRRPSVSLRFTTSKSAPRIEMLDTPSYHLAMAVAASSTGAAYGNSKSEAST